MGTDVERQNQTMKQALKSTARRLPVPGRLATVLLTAIGLAFLIAALTSCGGGGSPPPPSPNPVPTLTAISPSSGVAGGTAFTLTATGRSFLSSSVVRWNGSGRSTTFISSTQLTATIQVTEPLTFTTTRLPDTSSGKSYSYTLEGGGGVPPLTWTITSGALPASLTLEASAIASVGTAQVTVFNPAPGGGTSRPLTFTINAIAGRILGDVDAVTSDTTANFTVTVTDSATSPSSVSQPLSILVRAAGLGRNDTCTPGSTAGTTAISNGRIRASISPYGDIDVYSFQGTVNSHVIIETFAQRLDLDGNPVTRDSQLDTVLELLDSSCNPMQLDDDMSPPPNHIQDSRIELDLPRTDTYFIRVRDFRGDGRPDLIYELSLSGAN